MIRSFTAEGKKRKEKKLLASAKDVGQKKVHAWNLEGEGRAKRRRYVGPRNYGREKIPRWHEHLANDDVLWTSIVKLR